MAEEKEQEVQETENSEATETEEATAAESNGGAQTSGKFEALLEQIDAMSVRDLVDLVEDIEKRYNVSASAAVAVAAAPAAGDEAGGAEAVSTLSVILKGAGQQKVQVIKKIKEITGKGLKESKELVDNAPSPVKEGIDVDEANSLKAQLEEVGAEVELK